MKKSGRLIPALGMLLAFGCVAITLYFFSAPPARAIFFNTTTPTQENLWAHADVAKPTYTATNPPMETSTSLPTITETPASLVMEIVNDAYNQSVQAQANLPPPSVTTNRSKYILVDISEQHMYVYENDTLIYSFVASTGISNSTRIGTFAVQTKLDNAYGATWNIWMPNWLGIYYSGSLENGIHALPILSNGVTLWEGFLGRPVSYGCVVLGTADSILLYDWAEMGTTVEIQW